MPELPEVHTIVSDLQNILPGLTITQAYYVGKLGEELRRGSRAELDLALTNKKISGLRRVAKQVVLELESGENLVFHLKITGRLLLRNPSQAEDEFTRLIIRLNSGQELRFTDRNGYADAKLLGSSELDHIERQYGPEALDPALTTSRFHELLSTSREGALKQTLLNQKIISGVGNIYADEALLVAKLHPSLKPKLITPEQAGKLLRSIRQVLEEGIADRGTTIDSYLDPFGNPGKHQENLRIYGRTGNPCPQCGTVIEYTEVGGRRTFLCPTCQSLPQLSLF
jgi:formamidopyrimidine-DNA glycosylase